jgi:hypothetical protein
MISNRRYIFILRFLFLPLEHDCRSTHRQHLRAQLGVHDFKYKIYRVFSMSPLEHACKLFAYLMVHTTPTLGLDTGDAARPEFASMCVLLSTLDNLNKCMLIAK